MRAAWVLLLCLATAAAQEKEPEKERTVADVLADHERTLGDVGKVKALQATGSLGQQHGMSAYFADGQCLRRVRGRTEVVNADGVFVASGGYVERYRLELPSQCSMVYAQRVAAMPFPLLPYLRNKSAAAGLKPGVATMPETGKDGKRRNVTFVALGTVPDRHGVSTEYLLHPRTHHLAVVRFRRGQKTVAAVRFWNHKLVDGVLLPSAVELFTPFRFANHKDKAKLHERPGLRVDHYVKWTVNPDLKGVAFDPPGLGFRGPAKGFLRVELPTGPDPAELAVGDVDGDGKRDIAVACHGGVWVHFGGAVKRPVKIPLGEWAHRGLVIEDLDRDGRAEIVTTSRMLPAEMFFVVTFGKDRKPEVQRILGAPHLANGLVCADLDFDGLGDMISTGWGDRTLDIKFGNGMRGFRFAGSRWPLANRENTRPRGYGVAVGRLDKDHLKDIVIADGTRVRAFIGRLNGAFLPGTDAIEAGPRPVDVCLADLNGDGRQDLLVANDASGARPDLKGDIAVMLNTGKSALKQHGKFEAGVRVTTVRALHYDLDGHVDVAATSYVTGEVRVFRGDGNGNFELARRLRSGRGAHKLCIADFDGDGGADILASNRVDDTVTLLLNRTGIPAKGVAPPRIHKPERRARACERAEVPFRMNGLTIPYEFVAEFRIPKDIRDPSGIAFLGGTAGAYRQLVIVSDKEPSLFKVVLDSQAKRLLVGPRIPLIGGVAGRLDLEAAAFDHASGNLFLACESDSTILRTTLLGHVIDRVKTRVQNDENDGIEGLAIRRKKDGTPLLYVFRERMGKSGKQPPVWVHGLDEDPFSLPLRLKTKLPYPVLDQTGATVFEDKLFVVTRARRTIMEIPFDGRGFTKTGRKAASFGKLVDTDLGLTSAYGVAEGLAIDPWGDLYLLIDNNGQVMGKAGFNKGAEGRLLWFRALQRPAPRAEPREVVVKHIFIPWQGAKGNPDVKRTRKEAGELADRLGRELRTGGDFDAIAKKHHHETKGFPALLKIKTPPARFNADEFNRDHLPVAFSRLAFALDLNEVGVVEWHRKESPFGFHILLRIR